MDSFSRKALGMLKDVGNIGYAKLKSKVADIDVAVVKATRHDQEPPNEKYVRVALGAAEEIHLRGHLRHVIEARLSRTKNWMVAIKTLALIHRLIRDCQQPIFSQEEEELQLRNQHSSNRKLLAWMSLRFDDRSSPVALECSLWVRKYSHYLVQRLYCNKIFSYDIGAENQKKSTKDQKIGQLLDSLTSFRFLLCCLLDCTPPQEGPIPKSSLVQYALDLLVKECSYVYPAISFCLCKLMDSFLDMPINRTLRLVDVYKEILQQSENLSEFYQTSCVVLVKHGGQSEYPAPQTFMTEVEHNVKNYRHRLCEMEAMRSSSFHLEEKRVVADKEKAAVKNEDLQGSALGKSMRWDACDDVVSIKLGALGGFSHLNNTVHADHAHDLRMPSLIKSGVMASTSSSSYQSGDRVLCSAIPAYSYGYAFQLAADQSWIDPTDVIQWHYTNPNSHLTRDMASPLRSDPLPGTGIEHNIRKPDLHQEHEMDDQGQTMGCLHGSLHTYDACNVGGAMESSVRKTSEPSDNTLHNTVHACNAQDLRMASLIKSGHMASTSSSSYQSGDCVLCSVIPAYSYDYAFQLAGDQSWIDPSVMQWHYTNPNSHLAYDMASSLCSDPLPGTGTEHNMQKPVLHQEQEMDDQGRTMGCLHGFLHTYVGGAMESSVMESSVREASEPSDNTLPDLSDLSDEPSEPSFN